MEHRRSIDCMAVFVGDGRVTHSLTTEIYNISTLKYINLGELKHDTNISYDIIILPSYIYTYCMNLTYSGTLWLYFDEDNMNLTGQIPSVLGELDSLEFLSMSKCCIYVVVWLAFVLS